jgi:hypothetical protein
MPRLQPRHAGAPPRRRRGEHGAASTASGHETHVLACPDPRRDDRTLTCASRRAAPRRFRHTAQRLTTRRAVPSCTTRQSAMHPRRAPPRVFPSHTARRAIPRRRSSVDAVIDVVGGASAVVRGRPVGGAVVCGTGLSSMVAPSPFAGFRRRLSPHTPFPPHHCGCCPHVAARRFSVHAVASVSGGAVVVVCGCPAGGTAVCCSRRVLDPGSVAVCRSPSAPLIDTRGHQRRRRSWRVGRRRVSVGASGCAEATNMSSSVEPVGTRMVAALATTCKA